MIGEAKPKPSDYVAVDAVVTKPLAVRVPRAVAMLGISRSKLYELIQSGEIEIVKLGRATLIPVEILARFLESHRHLD